jgi:bifunctional DNA-binding transcriptional regulator/antitoxin component of YhaV-PrlF toxin-antitoxin module
MAAAAHKAVEHVEWRRAKVSSKRQVTIPQRFFEEAGIKDEVEFGLRGNHIIIRPVRENVGNDFADLILADLIKEGYVGEELLVKFRERQAELRHAAKDMIAEAQEAARKLKGSGDDQMNELFGDIMGG